MQLFLQCNNKINYYNTITMYNILINTCIVLNELFGYDFLLVLVS